MFTEITLTNRNLLYSYIELEYEFKSHIARANSNSHRSKELCHLRHTQQLQRFALHFYDD